MRRQVTLFWGESIVGVRVFRGELPAFDPALRVLVETLDDVPRLPPPRRARPHAATLFSALFHTVILALVASYAHFHPADPKVDREERLAKMQGYLGRIAEHDGLAPGDVATDEESDAFARDRGRHGGETLREDAAGMPFDAEGRAIDDRTPSLVPLAFVTNAPVLGAAASGDLHVAPSTLAPKLARRPRASSGTGAGGGGGGGAGSGGASSCVAFAHSSLHDPQKSAWIEFQLEDQRGRPVPNERYRVTLPDGSVHEGLTDARGLICFTGVDPGNAKITFPDVDATYVGSSPEPI